MAKRQSVMKHDFSRAPQADIPRSSFDRSHGVKTTFDAGFLVPILCDEALPGDTFNVRMTGFGRMATPIFPIMDNIFMETFFFSVPVRQVWDNFRKFCGEQVDPGDSTDFTVPTRVTASGYPDNSIFDYMGIPTNVVGLEHSVLWNRAYTRIWNEWFRDQNLQDSALSPTDDGPDSSVTYSLLRRGKRHDYFTSCLPWPQKGDSVDLPLGTSAPVTGIGFKDNESVTGVDATGVGWNPMRGTDGDETWVFGATMAADELAIEVDTSGASSTSQPMIYADLTNAAAATINQLRQAFQIQKLLERDARGGTRYAEIVKAHFRVDFQDVRYRPEYLGGGSSPVNVSQVPQTSSTDATTPQGNLSAFATASLQGHGFTKSFTEHCIVMGLVNVRADLTYQQGLNRMFSRQTRYDFYWPALAHIGEQAVLNKEIYAQGTGGGTDDDDVFGYQERFGEYRYKPSLITGKFRSGATGTLDPWHLSQDFSALPVLNSSFIEDQPPIDRVVAVPTEPDFLFDAYFSMRCARPMPMYGVPGLIDHF